MSEMVDALDQAVGRKAAPGRAMLSVLGPPDERVNDGSATPFALDTILNVLLVQVIVGLGG